MPGKAITKVDTELAKLNMMFDRGLDLDNRFIYIFDEIDARMAENVVMSLSHLSREEGKITIIINSPGGSVNDMFAIYDAIQATPNEIVTVGIGEICSAAGLLLVCGDKRLASPNAMFMAHNVQGGIDDEGEMWTANSQMKATLVVWKMWAKCMAKHTNHTENYWFKELGNTVRELWLTTDQMKQKKHGVVDGVWE